MLRNPAAVPTDPTGDASTASFVSLLGEQRAAIVRRLQHVSEAGVSDLAEHLGVSEVATRRHLAVLIDEGFVDVAERAEGPGRPAKRYSLTERARSLFPQRYADMAGELLDFITSQQGRDGLRAYLQWRLERETAALGEQVTAEALPERLNQLAEALSDAGFDAKVADDGETFLLRQDHCTIFDVAKEHPEMCAYEAATFSRVLGTGVHLRRQETLASGGSSCVCCVTPRGGDEPTPTTD